MMSTIPPRPVNYRRRVREELENHIPIAQVPSVWDTDLCLFGCPAIPERDKGALDGVRLGKWV
jgi:hypothetical protein